MSSAPDPAQQKAVEDAVSGVEGVRQGKVIEIDLAGTDPEAAERQVTEMCEKLLANTVIESYKIDLS